MKRRLLVGALCCAVFVLGYGAATMRSYSLCHSYWANTIRSHYEAFDDPVPAGLPERKARETCMGEAKHIVSPWVSSRWERSDE